MTLLFELIGVAFAVTLAGLVVSQRGRPPARAALTALIVALAGYVFWSSAFVRARAFVDGHEHDSQLTRAQALALPGSAFGAREDVLAWADARIPRNADVFLDCALPRSCPTGIADWVTYRLAPRVFTDFPAQAQWVLFYDASPRPILGVDVGSPETFGPRFAVARVKR